MATSVAGGGNPTTDPNLGTILRQFGGPKGSGLALMFECLASLMAGIPLPAGTVANLQEVADRFEVPMPTPA